MKKKTTEQVLNEFKNIHGDKYDYSLVKYNGDRSYITVICKEHGKFQQRPHEHLRGRGCNICGGTKKKTEEQVLSEFKKTHGNRYDYSLVKYINNKSKVKIICYKHGIFEQIPYHHKNGINCPDCNINKGELNISIYLDSNNIKYIKQKIFKDCKYIKPLPFDFYLLDYNICIEFDGEQHNKVVEYWGGEIDLIKRQKRDQIKNEYCQNNNIRLIRIKFDENIEEKLNELFNS